MPPKRGKKGPKADESAIYVEGYKEIVAKRFKWLYHVYEAEDSDVIKEEDFNYFVRSLGICPTNAKLKELATMCRDVDQSYFTKVKMEEVLGPLVVKALMNPNDELAMPSEEQVINALKSLDQEHKGSITAETLKSCLSTYGEKFDQNELTNAQSASESYISGRNGFETYAAVLLYAHRLYDDG